MGHHIDEQGRFKSDKYPDLAPDKVVINLTHPEVWPGLLLIAQAYAERDLEFGEDLKARVLQLQQNATKMWCEECKHLGCVCDITCKTKGCVIQPMFDHSYCMKCRLHLDKPGIKNIKA